MVFGTRHNGPVRRPAIEAILCGQSASFSFSDTRGFSSSNIVYRLWIATPRAAGIASYSGGQFRTWVALDGQSNDFVRVMMQDQDGTIWAGTDRGLLRLNGGRFVQVDGTASIPPISVHSIYRDRVGHMWVGGWRLMRIDGKIRTLYSLGTEASQEPSQVHPANERWNAVGGNGHRPQPHAPWARGVPARSGNYQHCARAAPDAGRCAVDRHHRAGSLHLRPR